MDSTNPSNSFSRLQKNVMVSRMLVWPIVRASGLGYLPPQDAFPKAKSGRDPSVTARPHLGEAHTALAAVLWLHDGNGRAPTQSNAASH